MTDSNLRKVFDSFIPSGMTGGMDARIWAKLCRDCKLIDGKQITEADVDIAFNKIKEKTARKISFDEFKLALRELARKFHNKTSKEQADVIFSLVAGEPKAVDVDRLIQTTKYDDSVKRVDESGEGKGTEGRQDLDEKFQQSGYVGDITNN